MECLKRYFAKHGENFCEKLEMAVTGIAVAGSSSTGLIAKLNNTRMFVYRFLQEDSFQLDDAFWRSHTNMVFKFLVEQKRTNF
jgi:hypothetical protein